MLNIVIFGAPGSGKGTQSERIVEKYGLDHISTGEVLRGEIAAGTELGKTAKALIDHGQLIPDALMIEILAAKLDALSPLSVLTRGYSFVSDGEGKVQKKASGLTLGQSINISFSDGNARCKVEEINVKE